MKSITRFAVTVFFLVLSKVSFSQKEFFRSKQEFGADHMKNFYSSVTIHGNMILFNANDYKLYAYNKTTGEQQWVSSLEYKTTRECYVDNGIICAPFYRDKQERVGLLDSATGNLIKLLPVGYLESRPVVREGVLFGTAIYEGGNLFAYDIKNDSLLWWRFLAHGVSTQPYYFTNYIQANAEANNWVRINYKGQLMDTTCKEKADIFVRDIPCIKIFGALSHDGYELDEKFAEKVFNDKEAIGRDNVLTGQQHSFIMRDDKLAIIGNKRKLIKLLDLPSLLPEDSTEYTYGLKKLLLSTEKEIWFVYDNKLIEYDHKANKLVKLTDLSAWEPSQVVMDANNTWLISRKDGLLYGLTF